ncbi:MAG: lipoprotein-releasing ABC transporter permease subunit [Gammaproteobacteria bacterium]|nr:lipoprotein-releasing ABC transporter permease subunit [Gammaproteobacteria bacterium]MDP7094036.1 lipoprotein-releasing ABC transporter permease subunit [Gammaproteobacteria bacterium]MDP7270044.1 lipoprotein-releasing ABC transporter permease subunit [Gammaproteobacteria bacterium]HJP03661.1 lipoprotein-releasing ABC transporter permease subunit [Gammaproteobacteria bacterium]
MNKPLALFLGLRYLRASKGNSFISFVTAASVIGVALGVATLIVVLSVMNGFEIELRDRLLGMTAHASVLGQQGGLNDWETIAGHMQTGTGISGAAPYIELEGMVSGPAGYAGAVVTGIDPERERTVSKVADNMLTGNLDELQPGSGKIVLGRALAQRIGVSLGQRISVLVPQPLDSAAGVSSRLGSFEVVGLFELGVQDHDTVRALISLADANELGRMQGRVSGIRIVTTDIFAAPGMVRRQLSGIANSDTLRVRDWTQENASYFRAIRIEKLMMALLLSLIIGVATFNIVASLVMVVTEKRGGIAILRTMGCSRQDIVKVFVLQGTLVGWIGAVIGIILGIAMAMNIGTLAPALEQALGFQFMPADLYYLTELPSDLRLTDVFWVGVVVLILTSLATVYPSLRAAGIQPAEVLRYE